MSGLLEESSESRRGRARAVRGDLSGAAAHGRCIGSAAMCIPAVLLSAMGSDETLAVLNGAGLIACAGFVTVAGMAALVFRRW